MNEFYKKFEERHRGSRELIKKRLCVYMPFVAPLALHEPSAKVLDIGCGRGEWLELMQENGFSVYGVDLDDGMLQACLDKGLAVENKDALTALREQPDNSLAVVSAFHVVEHIDFDYLQQVVAEAHRALKPGGVIILETPNPENIYVASCSFYLDPTHIKPIPPQLLSFVVESAQFKPIKVLRVQESEQIAETLKKGKDELSLMRVIDGASPDYSVVAQKVFVAPAAESGNGVEAEAKESNTPEEQAEEAEELTADGGNLSAQNAQQLMAQAFAQDYGVSIVELTHYYDQQQKKRQTEIQNLYRQLEARMAQTESQAIIASAQLKELEQRSQEAEMRILALLNSRSWRITEPLRALNAWAHLRPGTFPRRVIGFVYRQIKKSPTLLGMTHRLASRLPFWKQFVPVEVEEEVYEQPKVALNPRSKIIYDELNRVIAQRRKVTQAKED